jgi:hypothetical protein
MGAPNNLCGRRGDVSHQGRMPLFEKAAQIFLPSPRSRLFRSHRLSARSPWGNVASRKSPPFGVTHRCETHHFLDRKPGEGHAQKFKPARCGREPDPRGSKIGHTNRYASIASNQPTRRRRVEGMPSNAFAGQLPRVSSRWQTLERKRQEEKIYRAGRTSCGGHPASTALEKKF